jgi:predicted TPR repeat methyltransferase
MWVALGNCFESLDRDNQARDCYKRASLCENADKETAWLRLARVFQKTGNMDAAATYYKQVLELDEQDRVSNFFNLSLTRLIMLTMLFLHNQSL